ncbi:glycine zipper 2TM domain-containing protein [Phenylobacterium sp.]|uniref:glycine zipper 2TM domain-containing protein n=1 Tax=Phenylobacterium sp. TaxID=1871053 RepID=UPI002897242A|nr:glycine zipper 2TM domain-containing protein [Phenylobacterium sp.]
MRPSQVTAAVVAVALALPAAAGAQPTLRQGSPLSSIFGCDAGGDKQAGGAVIGGLVGGVVGSNLAKNERTLGAVLGAAAGAAAGSYIGCRMQRSDQQKAQAAAEYALDRGGSQSWSNPETGASGDVRVVSTSNGGGGGGQGFDALARVSGTPWLLAGRDGMAIGYVSDTVVRPSGGDQYAGGNSVCRTFDQTIRTQGGAPETSRHTACKGADGQWVVQS